MQRDHVSIGQQLGEVDQGDAFGSGGDGRVAAQHAPEQRTRDRRQPGSDPAQSDDPERQQRGPQRPAAGQRIPSAGAHLAIEAGQLPHQGQGHAERVRGHFLRRDVGYVADPDAPLACRGQVEVIGTGGDGRDDPKRPGGVQHLGRHRRVADQ